MNAPAEPSGDRQLLPATPAAALAGAARADHGHGTQPGALTAGASAPAAVRGPDAGAADGQRSDHAADDEDQDEDDDEFEPL